MAPAAKGNFARLLNGRRTCVFPSGNRYDGEFQAGIRTGQATLTFADGTQCQGTFENEQLNGRGTCVFPSGNRYEGEFRNNARHGRGVFIYANGTRLEGVWREGQFATANR
ncbi:hypothetical protein QQ054_06155 [Oscillatoria amoena NRMC-F 0135]|nr:hypothetical protein [Oscillatoria amoena NRMC-F 0135]